MGWGDAEEVCIKITDSCIVRDRDADVKLFVSGDAEVSEIFFFFFVSA